MKPRQRKQALVCLCVVLCVIAFVTITKRWYASSGTTSPSENAKSRHDLPPSGVRCHTPLMFTTGQDNFTSWRWCKFARLFRTPNELWFYLSDNPNDPSRVDMVLSRKDWKKARAYENIYVTKTSQRDFDSLWKVMGRPLLSRGRHMLLVYRYHMKNICHAFESLWSLWRYLYESDKLVLLSAEDRPKRQVHYLDEEEPKRFDELVEPLGVAWRKTKDESKGTMWKDAVILGLDLYPSLAQADAKLLREYANFYKVWAGKRPVDTDCAAVRVVHREGSRVMQNEQELLAKLREKFPDILIESIQLENYSLKEQIQLMQTTTVMITVHSGSIVHAMFMPEKAAIIQLHPFNTHFGTHEYDRTGEVPPYILNVELLTEKLRLQYFDAPSTDPQFSTKCTEQSWIDFWEPETGGVAYRCFFYSDFNAPIDLVLQHTEKALEKLSRGDSCAGKASPATDKEN